MVLEIFDYEAFVVGTYQTPVTFAAEEAAAKSAVLFPDTIYAWWKPISIATLGLVGLVFLTIFFIKLRATEDNE
jgi:hypothetical protein